MTFEELVKDIQNTSNHLQKNTVKAINIHITLRNWITGFFIVEFEQNGKERANYGGKLLENLSDKINIKGLTAPELSRCRQFYSVYPEILGLLTQEFNSIIPINVINKYLLQLPKKEDIEEFINRELKNN